MCVVIQLNISLTFSLSSLSERSIPGGRAFNISSILKLHRSETFIELLTAYISPIFNWMWSCFNTLKFCFVHILTFSLDQMVSKITLWHKNIGPTSRSSSLTGFSGHLSECSCPDIQICYILEEIWQDLKIKKFTWLSAYLGKSLIYWVSLA